MILRREAAAQTCTCDSKRLYKNLWAANEIHTKKHRCVQLDHSILRGHIFKSRSRCMAFRNSILKPDSNFTEHAK